MKTYLQIGWTADHPATKNIGFHASHNQQANAPVPLYIEGESHLMTFAPTGKGKGRNVIIPTLCQYPGAVLVIDPKGEAAAITARQRRKFGEVFIVDPFHLITDSPTCFNPLDIFRLLPGGVAGKAVMLTQLLHADYRGFSNDPFWDQRADALIAGLLAYIIADLPSEQNNLVYLRHLLANDDVDYRLAVLLDTQKEMNRFAYEEISQYLQISADRTRPSVLSTAQQHTFIFGDEAVANSVSGDSTFDLEGFMKGVPMTIFLVIPPAKLRSHAVLLRLWVATLVSLTMERKSLPEIPTLFMLDEAAQLGSLDSLRTAMTLVRGYGMRVWSFWQDLSQLRRLYPHDWETMINNADAVQVFGLTTYLMAKQLSGIMGTMPPEELLSLPSDRMVVGYEGGNLLQAQKMDYLQDVVFQGLFDPHPMYNGKYAPDHRTK